MPPDPAPPPTIDTIHQTIATFDLGNPRHREVLRRPSSIAALVGGVVQDPTGHADARWLYYMGVVDERTPTLIIQSPLPTVWDQYDGVRPEVQQYEITGFLRSLAPGDQLDFALAAAPRKRHRMGEHAGKVLPLATEEERRSWLERVLATGAEVMEASVGEPHFVTIKPGAVMDLVAFAGRLTVRDPDALWDLVADGVGPSKAHGAALLRLSRPS